MPGVPTKGCYTSQGSMRQGAGSPDSHTRVLGTHMFTHMHSHAHWAVPVTSFLGDSAQLESHTSKSPSAKQQEKRIRGERTVRQAGGPPGEWLQEPEEQLAEGGGGEGSDFLALGWLLGVGRSDYRGAGTQPARDNEVSAETQASFGAQRSPHNLCLEQGLWVITTLEKAAWTFVFDHVGGWPHRAWWLQGSSPGQQAREEFKHQVWRPQGQSPGLEHHTAGP